MKKRLLLIPSLVLVVVLVAFAIYATLTETDFGLIVSNGSFASSSCLVNNLSSADRDMVMTSLSILSKRGDPAGQLKARALLTSSDDYIWFNAALYLATIKDVQSVPYLIKGLKHPASRSYPDVVHHLEVLTGQTFGLDQSKWIAWWNTTTPASTFPFAYDSLQKQAAEIHTGSMILINRVIDPLTVSYFGSPITLIGIRLKPTTNAAAAQALLQNAIEYQFAAIQRDGTLPMPDGSVPAIITWIPNPGAGTSPAPPPRSGPPVPFSSKTCIQKYLLDSGLYELDLSQVHDPALRTMLESYRATVK